MRQIVSLALVFLFASQSLCQLKSLGDYDFAPNTPVTISNPLLWGVSAKCTITTSDASDSLSGKMLKGSGTIDGQAVPSGGLSQSVKNGDTLSITATALAEVQITNQGASTVHAHCDLAAVEQTDIVHKVLLSAINSAFTYDFAPNVPQQVSNPLPWAATLNCKATLTDASDVLSGKMIKGTGKINGQDVGTGNTQTITNGEAVVIEAGASAVVEITNKGANNVHVECSVGFDLKRSALELGAKAVNSDFSYDFDPSTPKQVSNPLPWAATLNCKATTSDASDVLSGKMIKGTGKINGQDVGTGNTQTITNGEAVVIEAGAGAVVEITNQGAHTVHVDCSVGLGKYAKLAKFLIKKAFLH